MGGRWVGVGQVASMEGGVNRIEGDGGVAEQGEGKSDERWRARDLLERLGELRLLSLLGLLVKRPQTVHAANEDGR